jgi:hypothetical protein
LIESAVKGNGTLTPNCNPRPSTEAIKPDPMIGIATPEQTATDHVPTSSCDAEQTGRDHVSTSSRDVQITR